MNAARRCYSPATVAQVLRAIPLLLGSIIVTEAGAGQATEMVGGCLVLHVRSATRLDSAAIRELCQLQAASAPSRGPTLTARYSWALRQMATAFAGVDSAVCAAVRCRDRIRDAHLVLYPDSLPNALSELEPRTVTIFVSTALVDLSIAVAATLSEDIMRRVAIQPIFGPPVDYATTSFTKADSGILAWLVQMRTQGTAPCHRLAKFPYPFTPADSGFFIEDPLKSVYGVILAHELAHVYTPRLQCYYAGQRPEGMEAACDSIAFAAWLGRGTPVFPVAIFITMGHLEALFRPLYAPWMTRIGDVKTVLAIRDWMSRAEGMMRAWRADSSARRESRWLGFSDTLLAIPLPASCTPRSDSLTWAAPSPPLLPPPDTPPLSARQQLERENIPYTAAEFIRTVAKGWSGQVRLFLMAGIDPNGRDESGRPALTRVFDPCWLFCPTLSGRMATLKTLVAAGADVNGRDADSLTVLMYSLPFGEAIVDTLLALGAQVNARDRYGATALVHAAAAGATGAIERLLAHGAEIDARGGLWKGDAAEPALVHAASRGRTAVVQALLAHGADVNASDVNEALISAAGVGDSAAVEALLARGAEVDARAADWTALMYAVRAGSTPVARSLLAHGADVNARDATGRTAEEIALLLDRKELIGLLRRAPHRP